MIYKDGSDGVFVMLALKLGKIKNDFLRRTLSILALPMIFVLMLTVNLVSWLLINILNVIMTLYQVVRDVVFLCGLLFKHRMWNRPKN